MESLLVQFKSTSSSSTLLLLPTLSTPPISLPRRSLKLPENSPRRRLVKAECGKGVRQFGNKSEKPFKEEEECELGIEEEWVAGKCGGGGKGIVELMECLEREAIMGDDQGTEPADYNRRAQIFDKSSRVFQALKNQQQQPSSSS